MPRVAASGAAGKRHPRDMSATVQNWISCRSKPRQGLQGKMGENGGPDVLWRMFENPKAEIGMVEEGDGLAERGDLVVLAIEVDGVVVVHAAGGAEREVEIEQCGWRRGAQ